MIQLTETQRKMTMLGCYLLMFTVTAFGMSLATIQEPVLEQMNGAETFSLVTLISSIGMTLMTPVGGRLVDSYGCKKVAVISCIIAVISGLLIGMIRVLPVFIVLRVVLNMALGTFTTIPYILASKVNPRNKVSVAFGMLATMIAVGAFLGAWLAGFFMDHSLIFLAISFPVLPLALGLFCIWKYLDEPAPASKVTLDWGGVIMLSVGMSCVLVALSYGPKVGWFNWWVIAGFMLGVAILIYMYSYESKQKFALIPTGILQSKEYMLLVAITFCTVFYSIAMSSYLPMEIINVTGNSGQAGMLQLPKTIVSLFVPAMCGAWVAKKLTNSWKAMALASIFIFVPCVMLIFVGTHMPIWFVWLAVGLTGIGDAYRSVTVTPAAQLLLKPEDLGIGTALIGFFMSLANTISASIDGIAFDSLQAQFEGLVGMTKGVDTTFLLSAAFALLGLILTVLFLRPMIESRASKEQAKQ